MAEPSNPSIEVVEEIDEVPVPVRAGERIAFLADHLGMTRREVAGKLLTMVFRQGLEWQDLEYLRQLTEGVSPASERPNEPTA